MITLKIDGKKITVNKSSTILDAARKLNVPIPTLCYHPELSPHGGCRLCLVEIRGSPKPVASCSTFARDGMDVITSSPRLEQLRRTTLELILSDHPKDCMVCERAGDCKLQELAYFYGIRENRFEGERRSYEKRDENPFISRDMEKCILCGQCVRVCDEVQGVGAIDFAFRGMKTKITPAFEKDLNCEFCGQCVSVCPTGALTGKMWARQGRQRFHEVDTVCPYCGCGCNITLHIRGNKVVRVSSRSDTFHDGWLCAKGRFGCGFIESPDRLTKPLIRIVPKGDSYPLPHYKNPTAHPFVKTGRGGIHNASLSLEPSAYFKEVSWEEALDYTAGRLKEIRAQFGPDSIGGLSSARCTNEENYLFQKFIRSVIGTNNVDHCARY